MGIDPRHQFQRIKGLCHIIIRADVKSQYLIRILRFCRQDDNRDAVFLADLERCMNPVQFRHHNINDKELDIFFLQDINRFLPVIRFEYLIAFLHQIDLYRIHNCSVVITNKNICHITSLLF